MYKLFCLVVVLALAAKALADGTLYPESFQWGTGGAAYQIEGGYREGGRQFSIWDIFGRIPGRVDGGQTGDVADDSYHLYEEDVKLSKGMGLKYYRLSIAWGRIINENGERNEEGIQYYHRVFDALEKEGITPVVTIYHWDVPNQFSSLRRFDIDADGKLINSTRPHPYNFESWTSPEIIPHFKKYAEVVFEEYHSKVHDWYTFNEPWTFCFEGFGNGVHAPGRCTGCEYGGDTATEPYLCAHHVLLSHLEAMKVFNEKYRQKGDRVGVTLNSNFYYNYSTDTKGHLELYPYLLDSLKNNKSVPVTAEATEIAPFGNRANRLGYPVGQDYNNPVNRAVQFSLDWYSDPLFFGEYPPLLQVFAGHRLPRFTEEQRKDFLKHMPDMHGQNYYSSNLVNPVESVFCKSGNRAVEAINEAAAAYLKRHPDGAEAFAGDWISRSSYVKNIVDTRPVNKKGWGDDECVAGTVTDKNGQLIGPVADSDWLYVVPQGLEDLLLYATSRYNTTYFNYHSKNDIKSPFYDAELVAAEPHRARYNLVNAGRDKVEQKRNLAIAQKREAEADKDEKKYWFNVQVTENGCDDPGSGAANATLASILKDDFRINYYKEHFAAAASAMVKGVRYTGYFAWSLLDNYEWANGYSKRFGLHYVDYSTPKRTRIAKNSVGYFTNYIQCNQDGNKDACNKL